LRELHLPSQNIPDGVIAEGAFGPVNVGLQLDRMPDLQAQQSCMVPRTARSVRGSNGNVDGPIL
jgi:hypothetical protein